MPVLDKKCLLLKTHPSKDGKELNLVPFPFGAEIENGKLPIAGCLTWMLANTGTASVFLWDHIEVPPGTVFNFPNYTSLPLADNVPIKYEGNYQMSLQVADSTTPPAN